jgi:hypothetical protein
MATEWQDGELAKVLKAARALPRAGAKQKAMSAMAEAAAAPASRHRTIVPRRKVLLAGAFVIALVAAGFCMFPRRHSFALADVAEAMANVRNVHFVGWDPSHPSGGRDRIEGWIEPRRARAVEGDVIDEFYDEHRMVEIRWESDHAQVTIDPLPLEIAKLLKEEEGFLRALPVVWPQAVQDALEQRGEMVTSWERQRLPDGRSVIVVDLTGGETMTRLTVDEATDLVLQVEQYRGGTLVGAIEEIEYNVDIPEEVFQLSIPEDATVVDNVTSPPEESGQEAEAPAQLKAAAEQPEQLVFSAPKGSRGGASTSPFHIHLRFEVAGDDEVTVTYLPKANAYRVTGKVRVLGMGLNTVVENAEFIAPRPPDVTVEEYRAEQARQDREAMRRMPPPQVQRQWDAKAKELTAAGADDLGTAGRTYGTGGYLFHALNDRIIRIWYLRSKNAFYVMGKARVRGPGIDEVVEDGWIKVSGPPPELPEE